MEAPASLRVHRDQVFVLQTRAGHAAVADVLAVPFASVVALHGAVALVTLTAHALVYAPAHARYGRAIWARGYFAPRWAEYAVTCTLLSIASVASSGPRELTDVVGLCLHGAALQALGCALEQRKDAHRFLLAIGVLVNAGYSVSTAWYVLGNAGATATQVVEYVAFAFWYGLFPLNAVADARGGRPGGFARTDWLYGVLSLSSKVGLFWLQVGEAERLVAAPGARWPDVQVYALGVAAPLEVASHARLL